MRRKVTLTKNFDMKTNTEKPWKTDSNRVIKENKAMIKEIWKMTILCPKTSKEF